MLDLRPLSLVEVLRKSWSSHVIYNMRTMWERHGLLDDSPSAYREGRGTENALLQVINGLEEAQECATNILGSSFDKTRAFDSLSRNAARIALYRMGVPVKVCEMLVGLDIDGKTVVRTPKARKLWDTLMQQSNNTSYEQAVDIFADIYFIAQRGVDQGDTQPIHLGRLLRHPSCRPNTWHKGKVLGASKRRHTCLTQGPSIRRRLPHPLL